MIYVIADALAMYIKVGFTRDEASLKKRIGTLQVSHPKRLRLLMTSEGDVRLEREIHQDLAAYRQSGEWFTASPQAISIIEARLKDQSIRYYQDEAFMLCCPCHECGVTALGVLCIDCGELFCSACIEYRVPLSEKYSLVEYYCQGCGDEEFLEEDETGAVDLESAEEVWSDFCGFDEADIVADYSSYLNALAKHCGEPAAKSVDQTQAGRREIRRENDAETQGNPLRLLPIQPPPYPS